MANQYYQQYNQLYGQQPSQSYGGYGQQMSQNAFQINVQHAYRFQNPDELSAKFFERVHSNETNRRLNAIQAEDLSFLMNEVKVIHDHFGIHWSKEMCKVMLTMLDRSKDGFMQYEEFLELQQCLLAWHQMFRGYDCNNTGYCEAPEILSAIRNSLKFNLSEKAMETILKRYSYIDNSGAAKVSFDDFVTLCVRLRALTDAFRARDKQQHMGQEVGCAAMDYDDFIRCVMCL